MNRKTSLSCESLLCDEKSFYPAFVQDLQNCTHEVIIESPFITSERMRLLRPIFKGLLARGVSVIIITRDPREHIEGMEYQSEAEIEFFEKEGIQTLLCTGNHHRKLAIVDRRILWEGSLNILSFVAARSCDGWKVSKQRQK